MMFKTLHEKMGEKKVERAFETKANKKDCERYMITITALLLPSSIDK